MFYRFNTPNPAPGDCYGASNKSARSNPAIADRFVQQENLIAELWLDALDLKRQRKEHAREQTLLRTLIDTLPDFIYVKDTQHRFLLNNRAHLRISPRGKYAFGDG